MFLPTSVLLTDGVQASVSCTLLLYDKIFCFLVLTFPAILQLLHSFLFFLLCRADQELIVDTEDPEGSWVDTHHLEDQVRLILIAYE